MLAHEEFEEWGMQDCAGRLSGCVKGYFRPATFISVVALKLRYAVTKE